MRVTEPVCGESQLKRQSESEIGRGNVAVRNMIEGLRLDKGVRRCYCNILGLI